MLRSLRHADLRLAGLAACLFIGVRVREAILRRREGKKGKKESIEK